MRLRLLPVAVLALLVALAAGAPAAGAAVTWSPCTPAGFECGALSVPLDHGGRVPGTVTLQATRVAAASNPTRTAIVGLAGGPGQAALPAAADFASILTPGLADRDLLVFDQRGTGRSGYLRCPALERPQRSLVTAAWACAGELGARRGVYRTADTVADLEDLRREAGYEKLILFGVSYGTKVALDYAAAHPDRTAGLILDSVVPAQGVDALRRPTFRAIGRVLRELCAGAACRGITASPSRDLGALVRRVDRRTLRGRVTTPAGRRVGRSLTADDLLSILLAGDLNPALRARLPGALRSALRGDSDPILRLSADADGSGGDRATTVAADAQPDSVALFAATRCEETPFPWTRPAGAATRARQATAAADRLPRSAFAPFTPAVALAGEAIPLCLGWPDASPAPAAPGPLPVVPAIVLDGRGDLRTPLENARAVAARIAGARLVEVPDVGHSVLGSDFGNCATDAVAAFFSGAAPPACHGVSIVRPAPVAPQSLAAESGGSRAAKTLAAVRATVADAALGFQSLALGAGRLPAAGTRLGGLRSGTTVFEASGIRVRRDELVPGVLVSGLLPSAAGASARLTVTGRSAAHGIVTIDAEGRAAGTLDGRRVGGGGRARAAAAAPAEVRGRAVPRFPRLQRAA